MQRIFPLIFLFFVSRLCAQQPEPAPNQDKTIVLSGATIHTGTGEVIEEGYLIMEKGKIKEIGKGQVSDQQNAEQMDLKGRHIYPGLIAANTIIGLSEIEAARATNDYSEIGGLNPNVRSIIAYNTDSKVTPTVRSNGILIAQVVPRGGIISGQSSIVELDGWNWEDAGYKIDDGIHLFWPSMVLRSYSWSEPIDVQKEKIDKNFQLIRAFFKEARAYYESEKPEEKNLRFEAMEKLFSGESKLFIHADFVKEIIAAVQFSREFGVQMVLVGGADAWLVTDLLKENKIPVILVRTHSLPPREDSDVDLPYKLPALLQKEGILFAIAEEGFWQQRNLPFNAGTSAGYGLTKEEALKTITSNAAKILGIDKTCGTLESGKDATLIVSKGDILDMRENQLEHAFIRGKKIDLRNIQKALYEKYRRKYSLE